MRESTRLLVTVHKGRKLLCLGGGALPSCTIVGPASGAHRFPAQAGAHLQGEGVVAELVHVRRHQQRRPIVRQRPARGQGRSEGVPASAAQACLLYD